MIIKLLTEHHLEFSKHMLVGVYTCQNVKLLEISCCCSNNLKVMSIPHACSFLDNYVGN